MAELKISLSIDKDVLDAIQADIAKAPKTMKVFIEGTVVKQINDTLNQSLRTYPRDPALPFIWSYDPVKQARARRWYFANVVKGKKGGRYVRTGRLPKSWKVAAGDSSKGILVTVSNDFDRIEYVQGVQQVPSHRLSGWTRYEDVLLKAEAKANDTIIEAWFDILVEGKGFS